MGLFSIYAYVSNVFLTRKSSAILHGNKFVLLTEWFSATSSCDVTLMSTRFASESVTCTRNVNIPELPTVARCASEQFHENLHKVYWTHSTGLRNCLWPLEIFSCAECTCISDKVLFCMSPLVVFQMKRSTL